MNEEGRRLAVTHRHGRIRELGTLGGTSSYASGLNSQGVAVGTAQRAFVYRRRRRAATRWTGSS